MIEKERILGCVKEANKPVTVAEIRSQLGRETEDGEQLETILRELEEEGKIIKTRKGRYGLPERMNMLVGRLQGHPRGYGFVLLDARDDVFVPAHGMKGAMHHDLVIVKLNSQLPGKKQEGTVVKVLQRANQEVVGTYSGSKKYGFVVPEEKRIWQDVFIPQKGRNGVRSGDLVLAKITQWPQDRRNPEGEIMEVIGHKGEPGVDILGIMKKHHLESEFPPQVLEEAERVPETVGEDDIRGRADLRQLPMVTIDSEDAKDLDDAVSIEDMANGNYLLGVHIADVAHYVTPGSHLDREARARGCSTYLVDRVIPMLPPRLSNGICSLNAREDRLALSLFMEIDKQGGVVSHQLKESVIRVSERLSYKVVEEILVNKDRDLRRSYRDLLPGLEHMLQLRGILKKRREQRGSIDFNFKEKKVKLDEQGKPVAIEKRERGLADEIIEEFMIVANEVIAEQAYWQNMPFIYRVHEKPAQEDLVSLRDFLHNLGYSLQGQRIGPKELQQVVVASMGKPVERLVSEVVLRSLKQARYSSDCLGHFGLAAKFYTHFTSPIRRYPDLVVHRVLKALLRGQLDSRRADSLSQVLPGIAQESSRRERVSEEAEMESVDLKVVEYMLDKEGQVFSGVVSGVTSFGVFVELANGVEGLVHVSNMHDDYYQYLEKELVLQGERTKKRYWIGDQVRIQVVKVNLAERNIDFELLPAEDDSQ